MASADGAVGSLRRLLLRLLLRPTFPIPKHLLAEEDLSTKCLGMIGTGLRHRVFGGAEVKGRGEFLQGRFPVQARSKTGREFDHGIEEAVDESLGHPEAVLEVDGPDNGFERVSEDR